MALLHYCFAPDLSSIEQEMKSDIRFIWNRSKWNKYIRTSISLIYTLTKRNYIFENIQWIRRLGKHPKLEEYRWAIERVHVLRTGPESQDTKTVQTPKGPLQFSTCSRSKIPLWPFFAFTQRNLIQRKRQRMKESNTKVSSRIHKK